MRPNLITSICSKLVSPPHHHKPLQRLEKPIIFEDQGTNIVTSPLIYSKFHSVLTPISSSRQGGLHTGQKELVFDPNVVSSGSAHSNNSIFSSRLRNYSSSATTHGPHFSADFECGNLGQVYRTGIRSYEIHILPDPSRNYSALWYFFKVDNLIPGEYTFTIVGFFRDAHLHKMGVQPTALSMNDLLHDKIGWKRLGTGMNFWCWKRPPNPEYALSFNFSVKNLDTMYFSYLYPYTYSQLRQFLSSNLQPPFVSSILCHSNGGVEVPAIFWDADMQRCISMKTLLMSNPSKLSTFGLRKPLIVIAARHHPGESNSSYAMEGFMRALFAYDNLEGQNLLSNFSFLILPMLNPDGVVCGYYRPTLDGYDMNRQWLNPRKGTNPIEYTIVSLLDKLVKTRNFIFFLDFHGHTSQCNAFTYGVWDEDCFLNEYEGIFPRIMAKKTLLFDEDASISFRPDAYPSTMRVALHHRYQIPFAYTLEMSFGGIDIGPKCFTQMTQNSYKEIGEATVSALAGMLIDHVPMKKK